MRRQRGHAECDRGEKILSSQEGNPECHNYASSGEVSSGLPRVRTKSGKSGKSLEFQKSISDLKIVWKIKKSDKSLEKVWNLAYLVNLRFKKK